MDPITLAITGALANLGQQVIRDAYTALKAALLEKYGPKSELAGAVNHLEQKPDSKARQGVLQEEVAGARADQDAGLLRLTNELLDKLKATSGAQTAVHQDVRIQGNGNIVTGQGDVTTGT